MIKNIEVPVIFLEPESASEIIKIMIENSISLFPKAPPFLVNKENETANKAIKLSVVPIER